MVITTMALACDSDMTSGPMDSSTGQGGSMTRFAINGNHMYALNNSSVTVFNITDGNFQQVNEVSIGSGMETIFSRGEFLYFGAADAMYIYSIANPANPGFVFRYQHIVSCDPVIVQGNRAYVTLRGGTFCNRGTNALEIIDITDPYNPQLIANHPMNSPHGLGIDNNILFICEGENGVKVFDVTDEINLTLIGYRQDFFAYDVIMREGLATITGEDGIFQFSYGDEGISLVSKIPVVRPEL